VSGPSFAAEVARGLPTAVTVAATDAGLARRFAGLLHGPTFRAYVSTDLVGVELGGAAKNVIAIAAGISDGLGFGANARAGLITRGLAEIMRLGKALGALPRTLTGLAGLGDLVLTATDDQSRNRRFGLALGRGAGMAEAQSAIGAAVEGIPAARALTRLARELDVEMPISEEVRAVLDGSHAPRAAVETLMRRAMKFEH
jgi:glycerol-3-phosphate dehydrogenase (NAD(P)+)